MSKQIKIILALIVLIILLVIIRIYNINKKGSTSLSRMSYGDSNEKNRILNTKYNNVELEGEGETLVLAIEGELNWDSLPLSEHFKGKYRDGSSIMPEKNDYTTLIGCEVLDENLNSIINILAYHKPDFFDFGNENPIMTIYHYKFSITDDKKLDDIELIKKEVVSATTGESIK